MLISWLQLAIVSKGPIKETSKPNHSNYSNKMACIYILDEG
jgi:hypothetical protein